MTTSAHPPLIGITCSLWAERPDWLHAAGKTYDHGKHDYSQLVFKHGATPVFLPTLDSDAAAEALLDRIDGLILSGGHDLDPAHYNQPNRYPASIIHPVRDRVELRLARLAIARKLPVLGICRGHQLLNVAFGGTLFQDSSLRPGTQPHTTGRDYDPIWHAVGFSPGTRLHALAQADSAEVSSTHHQLLDAVAEPFTVGAVADDGVVEAMEWIDANNWVVSVQWHPELAPQASVTRALLDEFIWQASNGRLR